MKKIIFIFVCIFCLCATNVQAQYKSFFADSTWEYSFAYPMTCYMQDYDPENLGACTNTSHVLFRKEDTIRVDGILYYHKDYSYDPSVYWTACYDHYIREDTLTGRLFRYDPKNQTEYLLCDMSLNAGDTFHLFDQHYDDGIHSYWDLDETNGDYLVDTVYYVNDLKMLELHRIGKDSYLICQGRYNISFRFMESIGPMYGIGAVQPSGEKFEPILLCLHKDDTLYYMTHEDLRCHQEGAAGITTYDDAIMNIYPNPASDKITVSFENGTAEDGNLYLTDIMGRILWQGKVTDNLQTISIHGYAPGLYTVLYMDSQGKTAKKVLVQ